ncbi:ABC transporter substrate-binding protein [Pseudoalteromonas luteoviolacea]|uniref:ABC transporter substrate-binding protein n=1 Tax=Pseudoalteromonas luteoviolacea TaxID=43657 RepID=UPI00114F27A2|nr:ABC transporter substrate-binding protein [Pseudoalteromonas luteoviolacea]TQF67462.1 substrate-binding domain-containing protein [Pseudoalteromonas luteoviolacea]
MKIYNFLYLLVLMVFPLSIVVSSFDAHASKPLKVTFINPGFNSDNPTGNFWFNVSNIMDAVAEDTNIELTTLFAQRNHILMKQLTRQALESDAEYLILVDEKRVITEVLLSSEKTHQNILFLLNSPNKLALERLSAKGFGVKAAILPDNYQAGRLLARELVHKANTTPPKTQNHTMLAFLGDIATNAATEREQGLLSYTNRVSNVTLVDKVDAQWSKQRALELSRGLLRRYRDLDIVWCANDAIAFGVSQAAVELGIRDKLQIGGINWDNEHDSKLDISIGGHVLLGGYLLIELKKYQKGLVKYIGTQKIAIFRPYKSEFAPIYKAIHEDRLNQVDFSQFVNDKKDYNIMTINSELNF